MATQTIEFRDTAARSAQAAASAPPEELRDIQGDKLVLNMGPSHPSTHGVMARPSPRRCPTSVICIAATRRSPRT